MNYSFKILAVFVLTAASSQAVLIYSGLQNVTVSNGFSSIFVDVDAGTSGSTQAAGWDIEAFFGGEAFGNSAKFQPVRQTVDVSSAIVRLELGDFVDEADIYASAAAGSSSHIGLNSNQFASGVTGYLGFRLSENDATGLFYGWMRVNLSNTGQPGQILDWAYDNTGAGIAVGAVPEPGSLMLLGLGASILVFGRRRKS